MTFHRESLALACSAVDWSFATKRWCCECARFVQLSSGLFFSFSLLRLIVASFYFMNWNFVNDEAEPTTLSHVHALIQPHANDINIRTNHPDASSVYRWQRQESKCILEPRATETRTATCAKKWTCEWKRKVCNTARIKEKITMHQHNSALGFHTQPHDHNSSFVFSFIFFMLR